MYTRKIHTSLYPNPPRTSICLFDIWLVPIPIEKRKKTPFLISVMNQVSLYVRNSPSPLPSGVLATARKTPPRRVKARLSHAPDITSDTIGQLDTFSSKIVFTDRIQASQYQVHMTPKSRSQAPVHEGPINSSVLIPFHPITIPTSWGTRGARWSGGPDTPPFL